MVAFITGTCHQGLGYRRAARTKRYHPIGLCHQRPRFREGDLVVLHRGNPRDENALHCDLQYDGETELEASLIRGNEYFLAGQPDGWIMDQDWFDASPFYLNALNTVADSQRGRLIILPLIQGSSAPKIDFARYERAREMLRGSG
jgi:hypothetical protein